MFNDMNSMGIQNTRCPRIFCKTSLNEKLDRAFKTLTKKLFMCAHKYGHPKIYLIKVFEISYCSWEQGLRIQLKSNIELYKIKFNKT